MELEAIFAASPSRSMANWKPTPTDFRLRSNECSMLLGGSLGKPTR
jgi:hypothetical protein